MKKTKKIIYLILIIVLMVLTVIIIIQNLTITRVSFFIWSFDIPVITIFLITAILFYTLGLISSFVIFREKNLNIQNNKNK